MNQLTKSVLFIILSMTRVMANDHLTLLKHYTQSGCYDRALQLADKLLISSKNNDDYLVLQAKAQIYLYTERHNQYLETAQSAYYLKKNDSPIYKAHYFAQKAIYYHFHLFGDSALKYADLSMKLLHTNWGDRLKIPYYQIYQIYGTTYLYRTYDEPIQSKNNTDFRIKLLPKFKCYTDSALHASKYWPCLPQDKAIIHRSLANRIMDVVEYRIRNNPKELPYPDLQISYADMAIKEYRKAGSFLDSKEKFIKNGLNALIALAYYCTAREQKGNNLLWPSIEKMKKDPIAIAGSQFKSNLYILQYFTQNLLSKTKTDSRIYTLIPIYQRLLPLWDAYILDGDFEKDTYGNSPYLMLSFLYGRVLNEKPSKTVWLKEAAGLSLENYRWYSQSLNIQKKHFNSDRFHEWVVQHEKRDSKAETRLKSLVGKKYASRSSLIDRIQRALRSHEALLFKAEGMVARKAYFLVTKNNVYFEWTNARDLEKIALTPEKDLAVFKRLAHQNWIDLPFKKILTSGIIKKLYVNADVEYCFDLSLIDTTGKDFRNLQYFRKHVNVIKVYNPIDFFDAQTSPLIEREITPYLINKGTEKKLPFSEHVLSQLSNDKGALGVFAKEALQKNGILHLIGHGSVISFPLNQWKASELQVNELNLSKRQRVSNDLVVLEICFSAIRRTTFLPDRDLHNNLISRGAKAVIASPYQTVDQSSAYIFEKFYAYLDQGVTVEDALQKAKIDYLKTHKGSLAHPIYWSTYELTTNVKDLRMSPKSGSLPWIYLPVLTLIAGLAGSVWWSLRRRKLSQ